MATSTESSKTAADKYDKYLEDRIAQTAQQVKWVELLSFFLILSIFVFGLLFVLCVLDAWVLQLQVWMRWAALSCLAIGSVVLSVYKALPFFWHKVNPLYAAKKLEEGRPELKNSVINYLTVDKNTDRKSAKAIQKKMSQAAATDVANIPIDVTVDRSNMIMAGYMLAGVIAVFALYKIFSPKDPFQTISRVILPSAELMAPARVRIADLQPGDTKKYFGESIEISARIKGLKENESAKLLITSESGTKKDFALAMTRKEDSSIYTVVVGEENGLQESFNYRVEAGDARSIQYQVEVRTCPTIFVEKIAYSPPSYTGVPNRVDDQPQLISGVEGAVAHITARTNLPIETAYLQLLREVKSGDSDESSELKVGKSIRLDIADDFSATCDLTLELNAKRDAQRFSHYQLVFTTTEGDKSENPNLTKIEIIPDIKPEIEVLSPKEKVIQVPQNQVQWLEIAAVDPDYGLTSITVVGENKGTRLFEKLVFKSESELGAKGKRMAEFPFQPDKFGLKKGDEVVWFARAEDNRAVGPNQILAPNRSRTENYKIVVTSPIEKGSGHDPSQDDPQNNQPETKNSDEKDPEKNQPNNPQPRDRDQKNPKNNENQSPKKGNNDPQKDQKKSQGSSSDQKQKSGSEQKKQSPGNDQKQDPQKSGSKKSPQKDQKNESGKKDSGGKESQSKGEDKQPKGGKKSDNKKENSGGSSQKKTDPQNSQNNSANQKKQSGDSKQSKDKNSKSQGEKNRSDSNQSGDAKSDPTQNSGGNDSNSKQEYREPNGNPNDAENDLTNSKREPGEDSSNNQKPQNSKEAFEKLKKYFDEKEKERNEKSGSRPETNQDDRNSKGEPSKKNPDTQNPESGDNETGDQKSPAKSNDSNRDESKSKSPKKESDYPAKGDENQNKKDAGNQPQKGKQDKSKDSDGNKDSKSQKSKNGPKGNESRSDKGNSSKADKSKSDSSNNSKNDPASNAPKKNKSGDKNSDDKNSKQKAGDSKNKSKGNQDSNNPKKSGDKKGAKDESGSENKSGKQKDSKNGKDNSKTDNSNSKQPKNDSGGNTGDVDQSKNQSGDDSNKPKSNSKSKGSNAESQADKANLDYARKTTDLVLEKLKNQKENPDDKLLKDLNWTEDELKDFAKKWEAMRQKAKSGNSRDKKRFDEALKSLGLKNPNSQVGDADLKNDGKTGYRQKSGTRKVPSDFAKKFRAIQKSQRKLDDKD